MISFTGTITSSDNSMVEYVGSKCTLNIYLVSATKFQDIQAVVQIGNIVVNDETETFNAVTNLISYSYPISTGTEFEVIQSLVLADLRVSYPDNTFSIV